LHLQTSNSFHHGCHFILPGHFTHLGIFLSKKKEGRLFYHRNITITIILNVCSFKQECHTRPTLPGVKATMGLKSIVHLKLLVGAKSEVWRGRDDARVPLFMQSAAGRECEASA